MERCFKELKDFLRIRGYLQSEESAEKFLYIFFKDRDEKYSSLFRKTPISAIDSTGFDHFFWKSLISY